MLPPGGQLRGHVTFYVPSNAYNFTVQASTHTGIIVHACTHTRTHMHSIAKAMHDEARGVADAYRRAVDLNARDYRAWYGLGQTYELLHMPFYALHYYRQATQLRPHDARMWCASLTDKFGSVNVYCWLLDFSLRLLACSLGLA